MPSYPAAGGGHVCNSLQQPRPPCLPSNTRQVLRNTYCTPESCDGPTVALRTSLLGKQRLSLHAPSSILQRVLYCKSCALHCTYQNPVLSAVHTRVLCLTLYMPEPCAFRWTHQFLRFLLYSAIHTIDWAMIGCWTLRVHMFSGTTVVPKLCLQPNSLSPCVAPRGHTVGRGCVCLKPVC